MKSNAGCYEILLGYGCNARCLFCSQGGFDRGVRSSFEKVSREIYSAARNGYARIGFSGGEPTLHPELPKMLKLAVRAGFGFIRIQTNGIILSDAAFCRELAASGLTFCKFSFTSLDASVHDKLVGFPGAFDSALKGLKNMRKLKIRLGNNILVNKLNYRKLPEILEFFLNRGVSHFVIIFPVFNGWMKKNHKKLGVSLRAAAPYLLKAAGLMKKQGLEGELLFLNVPPCFLPGYEDSAIGLERYNTLVSDPEGGKHDLDENTGLNGVYGPPCLSCRLRKKCRGADKNYIEIFGWDGFSAASRKKNGEKNAAEKIFFSDNEKCLLEILKKNGEVSTSTALKLAEGLPLCRDCSDGNAVLNAGGRLEKAGFVVKKLRNGIYYWSLSGKGYAHNKN